MAKSQKVKINIEDIFHVGMHTKESMAATTRHPMWPVAVACYGLCEGRAVIGKVTNDTIRMVNKTGFYIAELFKNDSTEPEYMIKLPSSPTVDQFTTHSIVSKNIKYIVNKLSKTSLHPAKLGVIKCAAAAEQFVNLIVKDMLVQATARLGEVKSRVMPLITLPESLATAMVLLYKGVLKKEDMAPSFVSAIDDEYNKYLKASHDYRQVIADLRDFFSEDKWMLFTEVSDGIVLGAFGKQPLLTAIDTMEKQSSLYVPCESKFSYADQIMPFRWYKSLDDIPSEIKADVHMQLMMLKTHTNSQELIPDIGAFTQGTFWPGIGAVGVKDWSTSQVIAFSK